MESQKIVARAAKKIVASANGIQRIALKYAGGGDSGNVEEISFFCKGSESDPDDPEFINLAKDSLWNMVVDRHGGFWNNEGGDGSVVIDLENRVVVNSHCDFVDAETDIETHVIDNEQIKAIQEAMKTFGIKKVCVSFNGYADEGFVNEVIVEPENPDFLLLQTPFGTIATVATDVCEEMSDKHFQGYDIDDGGQGDLIIYQDNAKIFGCFNVKDTVDEDRQWSFDELGVQ